MSDLQKEASTASLMARLHAKLSAVIDDVPDRFKMKEIMSLAGLNRTYPNQLATKIILNRDLRCTEVGYGANTRWKKP